MFGVSGRVCARGCFQAAGISRKRWTVQQVSLKRWNINGTTPRRWRRMSRILLRWCGLCITSCKRDYQRTVNRLRAPASVAKCLYCEIWWCKGLESCQKLGGMINWGNTVLNVLKYGSRITCIPIPSQPKTFLAVACMNVALLLTSRTQFSEKWQIKKNSI